MCTLTQLYAIPSQNPIWLFPFAIYFHWFKRPSALTKVTGFSAVHCFLSFLPRHPHLYQLSSHCAGCLNQCLSNYNRQSSHKPFSRINHLNNQGNIFQKCCLTIDRHKESNNIIALFITFHTALIYLFGYFGILVYLWFIKSSFWSNYLATTNFIYIF